MNALNLVDRDNKFSTIYYGIVKKIDDPTKQGRIKLEIPEIFGDTDPEQLPWIYPIGYNSGLRLFNVPDLETEVGVFFIGDFYTGFYGIGKYTQGETKIFDADYPDVYGFEDLQGNYLTINKKTGEVRFHHLSGSEFVLDKEGNTKANITGNLNAKITKDVNLEAVNVNLKASGTVKVDAPKTELGSGGKPIARLGDQVRVGDKTGSIISAGTNTSI